MLVKCKNRYDQVDLAVVSVMPNYKCLATVRILRSSQPTSSGAVRSHSARLAHLVISMFLNSVLQARYSLTFPHVSNTPKISTIKL